MSSLEILRLADWNSVSESAPEWNEFLAESAHPTIFLTWEWLTSWWANYGDDDELVVLVILGPERRIAGLAPFYLARRRGIRRLRFVGTGEEQADNLTVIAKTGEEEEVSEAVLRWIREHADQWDILELATLPSDLFSNVWLTAQLQREPWVTYESRTAHFVAELPETWNAYLAKLSARMKWNLEYQIRRLKKSFNVSCRRCASAATLQADLETLFKLHSKRWRSRGVSVSVERRRPFYQQIAARSLERGWLDLWVLELDGKPSAAHLGFRYGGVHAYLDSGFDPSLSAFSVGNVLRAFVIQELIANRIARFDFLEGDDPYKKRWAADTKYCLALRSARRRSVGALYLRAAEVRRKCHRLAAVRKSE